MEYTPFKRVMARRKEIGKGKKILKIVQSKKIGKHCERQKGFKQMCKINRLGNIKLCHNLEIKNKLLTGLKGLCDTSIGQYSKPCLETKKSGRIQ